MPRFTYIALNARGVEETGSVEAADAKQATVALRSRELFPVELREAEMTRRPKMALKKAGPFVFGQSIRSRELAAFTRQLATLLRAGMPLLRGLEVLGRQERNAALRRVIEHLSEGIRSGDTLSEAMTRHPRVFDRLYLNMIKAGEAGGVLDAVLDRLARFQEKSLQLRGKIAAAMVYPCIVMAVAVLILAGLLVFVVPKFKQIFADLLKGAPLPPLTQWVLTLSDVVKNHLVVTAGAVVAAGIAFRLLRRTPTGARCLDALAVKLPMFGPLMLKAVVARFGRTLGTLLSSGVPILPALLITRDACGNTWVAGAISTVHDRVKEGASVAGPLEDSGVFPPMVASMIDVGEHTGKLSEMLGKTADIYEEEVDNAVAGLSSLIEPVLILFLAVVVGTIVIALFLPIVRIVQLLT